MVSSQAGRTLTDGELLAQLMAGEIEVDEQQFSQLLAEGVPAPLAVRRSVRRLRAGGLALVLGGALALSSTGLARASEPAPATVAVSVAAAGSALELGARGERAVEAADAAAPAVAMELRARGERSASAGLDAAALELALDAMATEPLVANTALILPAVDAHGTVNQQGTGTYYVVRPGDTLSGIAYAFYGNGALWRTIFDYNANQIANAHWIYPGQTFFIPTIAPVVYQPTVTPGSSQQGLGQGMYTVVSGDSLWAIAQRAYGNGALWYLIYQANRSQIVNPNLIYPGQTFNIPSPQTGMGLTLNTPGLAAIMGPAYTVQPGDNLWNIAWARYNDPMRWVDIYYANIDRIGPNPNLIFAGTQLMLP
ncbi:MAG: hypothetical protein OHK0015_24630 [Chloroflexi bacterium OHK40]